MDVKENIIGTLRDCAVDFLYYDRKDDADLPVGAIEDAVKNGEITVEEMVLAFWQELNKSVKKN